MSLTDSSPALAPDTPSSIARAATITSIGNLSSRIVGLAREVVKSYFFGNGPAASAFELASNLPTQFYDLLAGGMISSALVPTFSALIEDERNPAKMAEFGRLLGALLGLAGVGLAVLVVGLWALAGLYAEFVGSGPGQDPALVTALLHITIPTIAFLNLSGILTAALFARRKFTITAFTATTFNLTMIVCVVMLEGRLHVAALAVGMLAGSVVQVAMQWPGLRGVPIRLSLNWRHPGVSQVVRLFLPVAGGLALAQLAVQVSYIAAGQISAEGPATMRYAAQVIQFPLGMIAVAVSAAILPALSAQAVQPTPDEFKATLAHGLRLVGVLIVPASVGVFVLARPIVAALFERGAFTAESTLYTAATLRAAAPGLLFAAIDQPLIYAFYARRDTRTPTLIGLVSTLSYLALVAALAALAQSGLRPFTLVDLVLANSLKTGLDAVLMALFLFRKIGRLTGHALVPLMVKVCFASAVMAGVAWGAMSTIEAGLGTANFTAHVGVALGAACAGAVAYFVCAWVLGVREFAVLGGMVRRKLRPAVPK
ncbi:MAG: murein biosynthesis integral membrane protein MurJ [Anaerolineae bacterium]|nr:murein biosynthesis integral membrane protein MurJ [Thermoflexales bacterium]MDW8408816.1 murein biosynthesis integral membrane protein MurJ [Anaerolineae bacterium]